MAKGVKRPQSEILTAQLAKTEEKIEKLEMQLKDAKVEKKQIESDLNKTKFEDLTALLEEKAVTIDKVRELIEKNLVD